MADDKVRAEGFIAKSGRPAVRLTHLPSGSVTEAGESENQYQNYREAMDRLLDLLAGPVDRPRAPVFGTPGHGEKPAVDPPTLVGLPVENARASAERAGMRVKVVEGPVMTLERGINRIVLIVRQGVVVEAYAG